MARRPDSWATTKRRPRLRAEAGRVGAVDVSVDNPLQWALLREVQASRQGDGIGPSAAVAVVQGETRD